MSQRPGIGPSRNPGSDVENMPLEQCPGCFCMTRTLPDGTCGKCQVAKFLTTRDLTQIACALPFGHEGECDDRPPCTCPDGIEPWEPEWDGTLAIDPSCHWHGRTS